MTSWEGRGHGKETPLAGIIAVDDERDWLDLYAERLGEAGHTVLTFEDGLRAFEEIKQKLPDLVILDIRMCPSGRDMLRAIRRAWPGLPVVVSSSYGGYRDDPDFAAVSAFVDKSPDLAAMLEAINGILGSPVSKPCRSAGKPVDA
jgi:DNA-binding NtrC family response regulator